MAGKVGAILPTEFMYDNLVARLAKRFEAAENEIDAVYNFDLGPEFEITICKILQKVLPSRFGICRGFVMNSAGEVAGDDIIIYERATFPTIRQIGDGTFAQKEYIPIEAAYAYIEAKNGICLKGDGEGTLTRAISQAAAVKKLCRQRANVPFNQITRRTKIGGGLELHGTPGWPLYRNTFYTAVFARNVRVEKGAPASENKDEIDNALVGLQITEPIPEVIVAGKSNALVPVSKKLAINSPFNIDGETQLSCHKVEGTAFGIALVHLLWALDNIELGEISWSGVLANGLGLKTDPAG